MAELGTGKSVVVLAIVVGCFSILWPKIFYPMMQTALSLTAPKYDAEDATKCQFILDVDTTGYAFFANLCNQLVSRQANVHPSLRGEKKEEELMSHGLVIRCQTALRSVCSIDLLAVLEVENVEEIQQLEETRKQNLTQCLLEIMRQKRKRRRFHQRRKVHSCEGQARQPPHLHLPPRMREAMGESRPDLPSFHPSAQHHASPNRAGNGAQHLMKDGRPFPHPSSRQPPKPQPKSGGAMSIIMPVYTIGIVGFFLYTLLKLVFKKRGEETSDEQPIINNYHMDARYHRYILGNDRPSNNIKHPTSSAATTHPESTPSSKTFVNESKTKRFLEDFGKQKEDVEILHLKRKLQETEDALQQILDKVSENMNRAVSTPIPSETANDTPDENYDEKPAEEIFQRCHTPPHKEGSKIEELQETKENPELFVEETNQQKEHSANSSPDTESYELIGSQEDSGRSESEGSENASTLRQRIVHETNILLTSDDRDLNRNGSYKLSDILQF